MNDKESSKIGLHIWTIYDHPKDYPDSYVARLSLVGPGITAVTNAMFTADTLEELRRLLPLGLTRLPRQERDDPVIVEVWI